MLVKVTKKFTLKIPKHKYLTLARYRKISFVWYGMVSGPQ